MDDLSINMYAFRERLVWEHIFFMLRNVKTFSCLVGGLKQQLREGKLRPKHPHFLSWESNIPLGREFFPLWKDQNTSIIIQSHPLLPLSTVAASHPPLPADHPPLPASHPLPPPSRVFFEIYQIFLGIQFVYETRLKYYTRESYSQK